MLSNTFGTPRSIHVVDNEADFLELRWAWDRLAEREKDPVARFLLFDAALAAWETVARPKGYKLHVVVASRGNKVEAILPLVARRYGPIRVGRWLGPQFEEACEFLYSPGLDKATLERVWETANASFDVLHFPIVHRAARLKVFIETTHRSQRTARHPSIDLRQWANWETYASNLAPSLKREFRRDLKRLGEAGDVAFVVSAGADHDIGATVDWVCAKKVDWIVGSGARPELFLSKRDYFRRFYSEMQRSDRLLVFELQVNGIRIATQIALRWRGRVLLELTGWDHEWRTYSPGNVLAFEILRWAFENNVRCVDLGVGGHAYKYRFTNRDEEVSRHILVAPTLTGRVIVAALSLRQRLRRRSAAVGPQAFGKRPIGGRPADKRSEPLVAVPPRALLGSGKGRSHALAHRRGG
jgi:CelD/BcsL family acetyltransferase involved in cellulose biosynthesis